MLCVPLVSDSNISGDSVHVLNENGLKLLTARYITSVTIVAVDSVGEAVGSRYFSVSSLSPKL
jgi:hypothetical protein